jgi:hypothetical protein
MRTEKIKQLRPEINASIEHANDSERFQNETLRPILKFQNDLLLATMQFYIEKRKGEYFKISIKDRPKYIEDAIKKDLRFKSQLIGTLIGLFSVEEFQFFSENEAEMTRRAMDMLIQRLHSQIELI